MLGTARHVVFVPGHLVLCAGANTGIGFEAARELASKGARVVMAGRSPDKIKAAVEKVNAAAAGGGSAEELIVDLSDLKSVARAGDLAAKAFPTIDILVNNAGIMYTVGRDRAVTKEGFEEQLLTNVVGPALLTSKLLACVERADAGRIINVASSAHQFASPRFFTDLQSKDWKGGMAAYGNTKVSRPRAALSPPQHAGGVPPRPHPRHAPSPSPRRRPTSPRRSPTCSRRAP